MLSFSFISLSLFSFAALQTSGTSLRVGDFNIKYDTNPSDSSAVPSAASLSASNAEPSLVNLLNPRNNKRHIQRSRIAKQKRASGDSEKGQKPWTDRRGPMAEQILFAELDIVGLQEVLDNQLQDLRALLGNNYQCVGVGREDGDTKGEAVSSSNAWPNVV